MKNWQTKSSKVVYENPWISVREDRVITPDGSDGLYGVVSGTSPGVYVVPVDDQGNTYLVLQERYTIGQESWEIIAGGTDGEAYDVAAKRELLEEAGVQAQTITKMIEIYPLAGVSDHKSTICLATDLQKITDELDQVDGIISVRKVPLTEVRDMILRGEITDGSTVTSVLVAMAYLEQQNA